MQSILDPAILFFIFGVFAGAVRAKGERPPARTKGGAGERGRAGGGKGGGA